jgi:uncharacterized SAM-binding protein YcdF (DUF218 family)
MLFNPLSAVLGALLALLLLWLLTRRDALVIAAIVTAGLLWVLATPWASRNLQSLLESRAGYVSVEALPQVDAIVVLGGMLSPPARPGGAVNLSAAADRLVHAARLYALGKAPIVLVSGGHADGPGDMDAESVHAAALLGSWGVPASAILTETESTNTYENAVFSKRLLDGHGLASVLLVTSALHMPRALATFESAGIEATPAATDFETAARAASGLQAWVAEPAALDAATRALKEYLAWIVYRQRGWIVG